MSKSLFLNKAQEIEHYFDFLNRKTFLITDLRNILDRMRPEWKIPKRAKFNAFLSVLLDIGLIDTVFNGVSGYKTVYSWKTDDELTVMSGIKPDAYYTHLSAMFLNNLTLQIPKTHYLNYEHSKTFPKGTLSQSAIDSAFSKEQRKSKDTYSYLGRKIVLINGKRTGKLGIIEKLGNDVNYSFTDLERTLIDIAIRPAYSGGVFEVLNAYERALGRVDIQKLMDYLRKLDFIYPYHQVIGFYMDNAGYSNEVLKQLKADLQFNFYLTYNIRQKEYSDEWKLFYPKGFIKT